VIARNHWKVSLGAGLVAASGAALLGADVGLVRAAGLGVLAACAGLGPDLDKPPEGSHPGATAAESHGLASNALAELVAATHGGHRGLTHRYRYAAALGVLVAVLAAAQPVLVPAVLLAWWGAWPLYCSMPRRARWSAAFVAPALTAGAWTLDLLPATPWVGAAVALGWAGHIAADRLQSGLFRIGGPVEAAVTWCWLAFALGVASYAFVPLPPFS
jgi:hypothetical protein